MVVLIVVAFGGAALVIIGQRKIRPALTSLGPISAGNGEMEEPRTLRQATKLRPEEIDPEFGRPHNDLAINEAIPWLQDARQARRCDPRAAPLQGAGRRAIV